MNKIPLSRMGAKKKCNGTNKNFHLYPPDVKEIYIGYVRRATSSTLFLEVSIDLFVNEEHMFCQASRLLNQLSTSVEDIPVYLFYFIIIIIFNGNI